MPDMSNPAIASLERTGLTAADVRKNAEDLPISPLKYIRGSLRVRTRMETAREGTVVV